MSKLRSLTDNEDNFLKVFSHNTAGGVFPSKESAERWNPDNPEDDLYSILNELVDYKNANGEYHLKVCYPGVLGVNGKSCNEWIQTSNPVTYWRINGFKAIGQLAFEYNGYGQSWGGLALSLNRYRDNLMDDSPEKFAYWGSIGATIYYPKGSQTIAGPPSIPVSKVQLSVSTKVGMIGFKKIM